MSSYKLGRTLGRAAFKLFCFSGIIKPNSEGGPGAQSGASASEGPDDLPPPHADADANGPPCPPKIKRSRAEEPPANFYIDEDDDWMPSLEPPKDGGRSRRQAKARGDRMELGSDEDKVASQEDSPRKLGTKIRHGNKAHWAPMCSPRRIGLRGPPRRRLPRQKEPSVASTPSDSGAHEIGEVQSSGTSTIDEGPEIEPGHSTQTGLSEDLVEDQPHRGASTNDGSGEEVEAVPTSSVEQSRSKYEHKNEVEKQVHGNVDQIATVEAQDDAYGPVETTVTEEGFDRVEFNPTVNESIVDDQDLCEHLETGCPEEGARYAASERSETTTLCDAYDNELKFVKSVVDAEAEQADVDVEGLGSTPIEEEVPPGYRDIREQLTDMRRELEAGWAADEARYLAETGVESAASDVSASYDTVEPVEAVEASCPTSTVEEVPAGYKTLQEQLADMHRELEKIYAEDEARYLAEMEGESTVSDDRPSCEDAVESADTADEDEGARPASVDISSSPRFESFEDEVLSLTRELAKTRTTPKIDFGPKREPFASRR